MNSLVSVIIPFYNSEKFLAEAVQSVFEQTYDNWELLLIDDGSTDSSTQIAIEYSKRNRERIHYLEHASHQNRGMCISRNYGISQAKGNYLAFLDSDDVWLPDKLQEQVDILNRFPEASMIYGPALYWFGWTGREADRKLDLLQDLGIECEKLYHPQELLLLIDPLGKASSACPSAIMMRRNAFERVGGFEERFTGMYQAYEDQAFAMKMYLKEKVFVSGRCWLRYRKHRDSYMSVVKSSGRNREVRRFFLQWIEEFLTENGQKDTESWQALQRLLWPYQHPALSRIKDFSLAPLRLIKWAAQHILGPELYQRMRRKLRTSFQTKQSHKI
jgi:glycosyltransferase involved in cell wall biosynthesis